MNEITSSINSSEISFWKVIHNKFLLTKILEKVETSLYVNQDYKKIGYQDKLKFKEIVSLEWMIDKNQFQLLKCKIKQPDERIDIEFLSLYKLFQIPNQSIVNELSKLLIDYRQSQISKINLLMDKTVKYKDEPIKKLIQFLIIIHTGRNTKYEIVNGLKFNPLSTISNDKEKDKQPIKVDLFFIFSVKESFDNLLNDLLNKMEYCRSSFYEKPSMDKEINKILLDQPNNNNNKVKELHRLFSISNNETIFKWSDDRDNKTYFYYSWLVKYQSVISLLNNLENWAIVLSVSFNAFNGPVFKELLQQKSFNFYSLEYQYQLTYDSLYSDWLKRIDKDSESVYKFINLYTSNLNISFKNDEVSTRIISFILSLPTQQEYDKGVSSISTDSKDYDKVFPVIRNPYIQEFMTWGSIGYLTIQDTKTVDWLVDIEDNKFLKPKLDYIKRCYSIKFENIQVEEYACENKTNKSSSILKYFSEGVFLYRYEYSFTIAIHNCNVEALELYEKKFGDNYQWQLLYDQSLSKCESQHQIVLNTPTNETMVSLSNYLKKSNYKNISPYTAKIVYKNILKQILEDENFDPFSCIDLKYAEREDFSPHLLNLFRESISQFQPKQIYFFFKLFKLIGINPAESGSLINDQSNSIMFSGSNGDHGNCKVDFIENYSIDNFDECLNIYLNLLNGPDSNETEQSTYIDLILKVFRLLIKFKDIPIETVKHYHQRIQKKLIPIEINDGVYHSFFYLVLKSKRIANYILDLPFLHQYFNYEQTNGYCEYSGDTEGYGYYSINKYLDPKIFSYNYLFCSGASFDEIIMKLIDHVSCRHPSRIIINEDTGDAIDAQQDNPENFQEPSGYEVDYLIKAYNYNLQYLLNIRKVDLFFNHLEYIKSKLDDVSFTFGTFPKIISNNFKKTNCCTDLPNIVDSRVFKFSKITFELACHVLNQEQFKRFSKFGSYHSIIDQLPTHSNFNENHLLKHLDTINHIQTFHKLK